MSTLIFGYQGQLGNELMTRFADTTGVDRAACDITVGQQVATVIESASPDIVINAAAYNAVDEAEDEYDAALAANAVAPGRMSSVARKVEAAFVHFSTDYVFGNGYASPIDEARTPEPLNAYGRSKLLGERLALQNNPRTYVIRTTALYSHRRKNFIRTMIHHAVKGTRLTVVNDQFISPTWVEPLADATRDILGTDVHGTYHAVSQGSCSWFELAARTFEILGLNADLHPVGQDDWGAAARRPSYSALDDAMMRAAGLTRLPRWDDMLEAFLSKHGDDLVAEAEQG